MKSDNAYQYEVHKKNWAFFLNVNRLNNFYYYVDQRNVSSLRVDRRTLHSFEM